MQTWLSSMAEDAAAPELHTDPVIQSTTLKIMVRQLRISFLVFAVCTLAFFGYSLYALIFRGDWVSRLLLHFNINIYIMPLYMLMGICNGISARRISKIHRRLRAGKPFEHHRNYKYGILIRIFEILIIFSSVLTLMAALIVNSTTGRNSMKSLSEAKCDVPILSLADIDPEQYAYYSHGFFYREYTPLVPIQYTVTQNIHTEDQYNNQNVLQTNYYKAVLACFAEPVYDEMLRIYIEIIGQNSECEVLDTQIFDEATYASFNNNQYLIAYQGKTVVVVRYEGDKDLTDMLDIVADTFL